MVSTKTATAVKATKPPRGKILKTEPRVKRRMIYDTETTGLLKPQVSDLKEQPKIIEFALIEFDAKYNIIAKHSWLINPREALTPIITKITGLNDDDLAGKPTFIEVLPEIQAALLGVDEMIAHNMAFDMGMLTNELKRCGREFAFPYPPSQLCTVQIASDLIYGRNAKMTELYEKLVGKPLAQTHRALDDCEALLEILAAAGW